MYIIEMFFIFPFFFFFLIEKFVYIIVIHRVLGDIDVEYVKLANNLIAELASRVRI